jgi:imidazolonepropionase-like amidohydrolase
MKHLIRAAVLASIVIIVGIVVADKVYAKTPELSPQQTLALYDQELQYINLIFDSSDRYQSRDTIIRHADIVDPRTGKIESDQRIIIESGRVTRVHADNDNPIPKRYAAIDATGKFVAPGLTDMHTHTLVSSGQHLLEVMMGVTNKREMTGYPWMLKWREQSQQDSWIAPSMIVTGHMITSYPMGIYSTVVNSEEEARRVVREHHDMGYDNIKVHNRVELEHYLAINDEAQKLGIQVVGHIPHHISVEQAITAGHLFHEHFKSYINDRDLQISDQDYVTLVKTNPVWNSPTLYTYREHLNQQEADEWANTPESKYAPSILKDYWFDLIPGVNANSVTPLRRALLENKRTVLKQLLPVTSRIVAGTDVGGGYQFMVPGYALHVELAQYVKSGMSNLETLRATTTYAAEATQREGEFGSIEAGARADLLIVNANPLLNVAALVDIDAVMLRGRYLDRSARESVLQQYAEISAQRPVVEDTEDWVEQFNQRVKAVEARGYVFPVHQLEEIDVALRALQQR